MLEEQAAVLEAQREAQLEAQRQAQREAQREAQLERERDMERQRLRELQLAQYCGCAKCQVRLGQEWCNRAGSGQQNWAGWGKLARVMTGNGREVKAGRGWEKMNTSV